MERYSEMIMRLNDYLHRKTKHTNLSIPYSCYITKNNFPQQHPVLLNNIVKIKYRDMLFPDYDEAREPVYNIFETNCKVVRCDIVEPFVMICVSSDYKFIFVTDYRYFEDTCVKYPIQIDEFIGIKLENKYSSGSNNAVLLRTDYGEPCYSVIMEYLENGKIRFLLGDECISKCKDKEFSHKKLEEIIELRKSLIEGKEIYGIS